MTPYVTMVSDRPSKAVFNLFARWRGLRMARLGLLGMSDFGLEVGHDAFEPENRYGAYS